MKKAILCILLWNLAISINAQGNNDRTAIIYLSRTKNTEAVAKLIQAKVGGDLIPLELQKPYPENYKAIVAQVAKENETEYLPPLKTTMKVDQYDTLFIGFPTWGMQLPPPIKSFLKSYDLENKVIIPFNTHAGYGVGSGFKQIKELCPKSMVLEGFSVKGGVERDGIFLVIKGEKEQEVEQLVTKWLSKLKTRQYEK
ncbi:flavodoxin [Muricauda sp. CAU 1633]|uniref:flavodoxin family protein n=1 Tax=Allomuricauda sp. CAU 1633 TaxID=2816036 RepID=UPI001A9093D9|nr:flavodoxin [Muricauda sp. CAU 1633]MBO0322898.1 flavodoxin [Muricauda sp. CAU 1633]